MKVASAAVARGKVWTCGTSCSGLKGQGVVVNSTPSFDQTQGWDSSPEAVHAGVLGRVQPIHAWVGGMSLCLGIRIPAPNH